MDEQWGVEAGNIVIKLNATRSLSDDGVHIVANYSIKQQEEACLGIHYSTTVIKNAVV